jgi:hypothetical protein
MRALRVLESSDLPFEGYWRSLVDVGFVRLSFGLCSKAPAGMVIVASWRALLHLC